MAGALTPVAVPSASLEAARDLARAREQVRLDLMRCRHRLSKLLLRHGRVWDRTAWAKVHRQWLSAQAFEYQNTELAFIDNLAACDGLVARKQALDERLSWVALDPEFWPVVRRLRAFRGIDTLSALIIVLEVADFTRFPRAVQLGSWLGLVPSRQQSGETDVHGSITKTGSGPGGSWSRPLGITSVRPGSGVRCTSARRGCPTMSCRSLHALSIACTGSTNGCASAASPAT
jgi:transposase